MFQVKECPFRAWHVWILDEYEIKKGTNWGGEIVFLQQAGTCQQHAMLALTPRARFIPNHQKTLWIRREKVRREGKNNVGV